MQVLRDFRTAATALMVAFVAVAAPVASADSFFDLQRGPMTAPVRNLVLRSVTADAPGAIIIYDYSDDVPGSVMGMVNVPAGLSTDVPVSLLRPANGNMLVVLYAGAPTTPGQARAIMEILVAGPPGQASAN